MQLQRQAMEQRLGSGHSVQQNQAAVGPSPAVAAPAQGFLTRQRQAAVRGRNIHHQGYLVHSSALPFRMFIAHLFIAGKATIN